MAVSGENQESINVEQLFRDIIDYWTPDRMKNSIPLDTFIENSIDSDCTAGSYELSSSAGLEASSSQTPTNYPEHDSFEGTMTYGKLQDFCDGEMPSYQQSNTKFYSSAMYHQVEHRESPPPAATPVNEENLTRYPYSSVGKLYVMYEDVPTETVDINVTAFYIGQKTLVAGEYCEKLLTVAHLFTDLKGKKYHMMFVPCSSTLYNSTTCTNDNYEMYAIVPGEVGRLVHPQYYLSKRKHRVSYDICVLYVIPKEAKQRIVIHESLIPLELVVKKQLDPSRDGWKAIGYPVSKNLHEGDGKYLSSHADRTYEPLTVRMKLQPESGMSGGPWILHGSDNKVNGIQSSRVNLKCGFGSASPTFTVDLLDKLDLHPYNVI